MNDSTAKRVRIMVCETSDSHVKPSRNDSDTDPSSSLQYVDAPLNPSASFEIRVRKVSTRTVFDRAIIFQAAIIGEIVLQTSVGLSGLPERRQ